MDIDYALHAQLDLTILRPERYHQTTAKRAGEELTAHLVKPPAPCAQLELLVVLLAGLTALSAQLELKI